MAVRSRVLGVAVGLAPATDTTFYTCPAGRTALIKAVLIGTISGTPQPVHITLRTAGQVFPLWSGTVQVGAPVRLVGLDVVLGPGDEMRWRSDTGGPQTRIHLSGALLFGEPT